MEAKRSRRQLVGLLVELPCLLGPGVFREACRRETQAGQEKPEGRS